MNHNIVVDTKTWYVYPQLSLAGYVNAGEGLRGPHEPELYDTSFAAAERCETLGIEYDFDVDIPEEPIINEPTPEEPIINEPTPEEPIINEPTPEEPTNLEE